MTSTASSLSAPTTPSLTQPTVKKKSIPPTLFQFGEIFITASVIGVLKDFRNGCERKELTEIGKQAFTTKSLKLIEDVLRLRLQRSRGGEIARILDQTKKVEEWLRQGQNTFSYKERGYDASHEEMEKFVNDRVKSSDQNSLMNDEKARVISESSGSFNKSTSPLVLHISENDQASISVVDSTTPGNSARERAWLRGENLPVEQQKGCATPGSATQPGLQRFQQITPSPNNSMGEGGFGIVDSPAPTQG